MGDLVVTREMLAAKFGSIFPHLDERQRRLLLGAGPGRWVMAGSGRWPPLPGSGRARCRWGRGSWSPGRSRWGGPAVRAAGASRCRSRSGAGPGALLALVGPEERGDPESPLRWTVKSTRALAGELTRQGHPVSADTVHKLLKGQGFSLQANARTIEGRQHPDRDGQFRYIKSLFNHLCERVQVIPV